MSESESVDPPDAPGRATAPVIRRGGSDRITPPKPVREAVGMVADEPWAWFWNEPESRFYLRRAAASLESIPDSADAVGLSEPRESGHPNRPSLDFAIPRPAVDAGGVDDRREWAFVVVDEHTLAMEPADD